MAATLPLRSVTSECPICFEQLLPPIFQCHIGHLICEVCVKKVNKCGVCRVKMPQDRPIRALELEKVINSLKVPCQFVKNGCKVVLKYRQMEGHKLDCEYGSMDYCSKIGISGINGCEKGGKVSASEMIGHLRNVHGMTSNNLIALKGRTYTREGNIPPAGCSNWDEIYIFHGYGDLSKSRIIKFFLKVKASSGRVSWFPFLMGSKRSSERCYCTIKLQSNHTRAVLEWEGSLFTPQSSADEMKSALTLSEDCIRGFDPSVSAIQKGGHYSITMGFPNN